MVELRSDIYGESFFRIGIGQGLYTSELPSNIPDGFVSKAFNVVATGDSLENRVGIRQSSVDWHKSAAVFTDDSLFISKALGSEVAVAWSYHDPVSFGSSTLSLIRAMGSAGAGDGFLESSMPAMIRGICTYSGTVYFVMHTGSSFIYKISSINWSTDAITYTSIPSGSGIPGSTGLFAFKDRLWTISLNKLYYTNVATGGGLPETWASTNFVVIDGGSGGVSIQKIVPLGNKLIILTSQGAYTLLVEGNPASWILRTLDSESSSTHRFCAFESRSIVYYVNTQGVWATNGQSVAKFSSTIEDQFFLSKGRRLHTLVPYEDGMILSIAKLNSNNTFDAPNCRIFYSKLDPVGWAEWNLENGDGTSNSFGSNRIVQILSTSPKISTYLSTEPVVYMTAVLTDSTEASTQSARPQLLIFDGGENQARDRAGTLITTPLSIYFKTKYTDAGNPFRNKQNKESFLELFTSDAMHNINTSWDIDATTGNSSVVRNTSTIDFTVGQASNIVRIPSDFLFRRCAFSLQSLLQTNLSQIKIKDLGLVLAVAREETERVR